MSDTKTGAGEVVKGPLDGLRVIELGTLLAGPFCGQLLGDFGAEVIKVEAPGQGDPMRTWGQEKINGKSLWWPVVARNKKAITLDLRHPEGQCVLKELVAKSDFLLENFRPGTMENWGLGYETLSELNPGLIMIRVSGYGQTGPYSRQAGFGSIGEAMGGLRYVVGDPTTPPSRMGISIGDSLAATYACLGALAALQHRQRTGRGQVVDSAIYEAVLAMMESLITEYDKAGFIRERTGADPAERRPVECLSNPRRTGADRREPGCHLRAAGSCNGAAGPRKRSAVRHARCAWLTPGGTGRARR